MTTLVTGHLGYIGTHLMRRTQPWTWEGVDLKAGHDYRALKGRGWDLVIHLAASVSVTDAEKNPRAVMENNAIGLQPFLRNNRLGKLVFASTGGAMYGNKHLAREEDAAPVGTYGSSKHLAEQIIEESGVDHAILRFANVFGGDYKIRGEAACHAHFREDDPIVVYGGTQTRDFVHIDTVCEAILRAVWARGTFNIGSGIEQSVLHIAQRFATNRRVPLVLEPARPGEVEFISLDCTKARNAGLL